LHAPRRFGKSLLLSTLAALFKGKRELFRGLWIDTEGDYSWQSYPVIYLDLSKIASDKPEKLRAGLNAFIEKIALQNEIDVSKDPDIGAKFTTLVESLAQKGKRVVLLIDEYDHPLLRHLTNIEVAEEIRTILKDFYTVIKGLDKSLRFVILTGVSKFSTTSVFSGLNNLDDLTLDARASKLLGYTEDEISHFFSQHLLATAKNRGEDLETTRQKMREWYNGYCFFPGHERVYNPFSVLKFLQTGLLKNYWFATGTPRFLVDLIRSGHYPIEQFESVSVSEYEMGYFDIDKLKLKTLMLQTGYLTLKSHDEEHHLYTLGYPNREVRESFLYSIIEHLIKVETSTFIITSTHLKQALDKDNLTSFFEKFRFLLNQIPYHLHTPREVHYQTIFYLILRMIGFDVTVEDSTSHGRIDAVLQSKNTTFIFEFKIDASASSALQQIEDKQYWKKYAGTGKKVTCVGVSFNTKDRNIDEWVVSNH